MSKVVSRADVHAAQIAHRKASARDAVLKEAIRLGDSWPGADSRSDAERESAFSVAKSLEREYNVTRQPTVNAARERCKASGQQVANNARRQCEVQSELAMSAVELADCQAYQAALDKSIDGDADIASNPHYATFLKNHSAKMADRVARIGEQISQLKSELASLIASRPAVEAELSRDVEALAALAV